ncbi:MAG: hypothetical protein AAGD14_15260 [Planctomycetota bacterium]
MHGSVLQNKKYIKFANENTVEVLALGSLDRGIQSGDKRAGTYMGKDEKGNKKEFMISWPGLTADDIKRLRASRAGTFNTSRGIPHVAIVNPHTLQTFAGWNGGSAGKIMDAVEDAKKQLQKEYGKSISRKALAKYRKDEAKVRKELEKGAIGKSWTLFKGHAKKYEKKGKAFVDQCNKLQQELLDATSKHLDELDAAIARGDTKKAERELKSLQRALKGTELEARVGQILAKLPKE